MKKHFSSQVSLLKCKAYFMGFTLTALLIVNCQLSIDNCFGQNIGINNSGSLPKSSALLDIDEGSANNKGVLIPRVALSDVNTYSPISGVNVESLIIYDSLGTATDSNGKGYYYWSGTKWLAIPAPTNGPGTSGQVLTSSGAAVAPTWTTPTGAPQSCPAGFSSVNSQYCIETNDRPAATWFVANNTCYAAGGRLCSWGEWYTACANGATPALTNMTNGREWLDDSNYPGNAMLVGNGSCTDNNYFPVTDSYTFRCCFSK